MADVSQHPQNSGSESPAAARRTLLKVGAALLGAPMLLGLGSAQAQSSRIATRTGSDKFSVDAKDVQVVFVDLQQALTQASHSIAPDALAANAAVLAKVSRLLQIPMSFSLVPVSGQAGVIIPELAPYTDSRNTFRRVLAGSFTDQAMVAALAANKRKTLIVSGYATEVAVLQTVLAALDAGYHVHVAVDAVGSKSSRTENAVLRQMELAGAVPASVLSLTAMLAPDFSQEPGRSVLASFAELRVSD